MSDVDDLLASLGVEDDAPPRKYTAAAAASTAAPTKPQPLGDRRAANPSAGDTQQRDGDTKRRRVDGAAQQQHDPTRERPLLLALDENFPTFNTRKLENTTDADGRNRRALTHAHDNMAGCLEWSDRRNAIWDITAIAQGDSDDSRKVVVYAGGYPGRHVKAVAELFPKVSFIAIHPKPYEISSEELPANVVHHLRRFDPHEAQTLRRKLSGKEVVFIADTWSELSQRSGAAGDAAIMSDLSLQKEWVRELRPTRSSLKFWLPQVSVDLDASTTRSQSGFSKTFPYLKGSVLLPAYGPPDVRQSLRLLVSAPCDERTGVPPEMDYDCLRAARQILFFIKIARPRKYNAFQPKSPACTVPVSGMDGMNWRFDSSCEAVALLQYTRHVNERDPSGEEASEAVSGLSAHLSELLGGPALSKHPDRHPEPAKGAGQEGGGGGGGAAAAVPGQQGRRGRQAVKSQVSDVDKYLASL